MMSFRPIDEELRNLHKPIAFTISDDDIDVRCEALHSSDSFEYQTNMFTLLFAQSALDGFRVNSNGNAMTPRPMGKPYVMERERSGCVARTSDSPNPSIGHGFSASTCQLLECSFFPRVPLMHADVPDASVDVISQVSPRATSATHPNTPIEFS